jgi:hypothetical protein
MQLELLATQQVKKVNKHKILFTEYQDTLIADVVVGKENVGTVSVINHGNGIVMTIPPNITDKEVISTIFEYYVNN